MCDAKIRPFYDQTELVCEGGTHLSSHSATLRDMAYPGSVTTLCWQDDDRRNFRGDWKPCKAWTAQVCVLPGGHYGRCVQ